MTDGTARRLLCTDKLSDRWKSAGNKEERETEHKPLRRSRDVRYIKGRWLKRTLVLVLYGDPWFLSELVWKQSAEHRGLWELYSPSSIRHSSTDSPLESFSLRVSSFPFRMRCNVPCTQRWQKQGCSGRQWEWREKIKGRMKKIKLSNEWLDEKINKKDKFSVIIKRLASFCTDLAASMNRTYWILMFFSFWKCSHDQHINRLHVIKINLKYSKMRIHPHTHKQRNVHAYYNSARGFTLHDNHRHVSCSPNTKFVLSRKVCLHTWERRQHPKLPQKRRRKEQ